MRYAGLQENYNGRRAIRANELVSRTIRAH